MIASIRVVFLWFSIKEYVDEPNACLLTLAGQDQEDSGYLDEVEYVSFGCNSAFDGIAERVSEKRCLSYSYVFAKYFPTCAIPFDLYTTTFRRSEDAN